MAYKAFAAPTKAYRPDYQENEKAYYAKGGQASVETVITGNLLRFPTDSTKAAVTAALSSTAEKGKEWVKTDSPVDTGLLKSRWYTKPITWDAWRLSNDIFYTPFNEKRVKMLGRNLSKIQQELSRQLNAELPRFLG